MEVLVLEFAEILRYSSSKSMTNFLIKEACNSKSLIFTINLFVIANHYNRKREEYAYLCLSIYIKHQQKVHIYIKHIVFLKEHRAERVFLVEWLYHRCLPLLLSNILTKQEHF